MSRNKAASLLGLVWTVMTPRFQGCGSRSARQERGHLCRGNLTFTVCKIKECDDSAPDHVGQGLDSMHSLLNEYVQVAESLLPLAFSSVHLIHPFPGQGLETGRSAVVCRDKESGIMVIRALSDLRWSVGLML